MADTDLTDDAAAKVAEHRETIEGYALKSASKAFGKTASKYKLGHSVSMRVAKFGAKYKDNKWFLRFPNEFEEDSESDDVAIFENYDLLNTLGKVVTVL